MALSTVEDLIEQAPGSGRTDLVNGFFAQQRLVAGLLSLTPESSLRD